MGWRFAARSAAALTCATRTLDVHIRRLREALNAEGELDVIRTVRAAGYALDTESP